MTSMRNSESKMARVVVKSTVHDQPDDSEFWNSKSMTERVAAVEILRQRWIGVNDGTRQGLQRVCRIIHRS